MIPKLQSKSLRTVMPYILVSGWVIFLGLTTWNHAFHSNLPPLYDPLGYFQKGLDFWRNIDQGHWLNPFNIQPTTRPPGTILLAAPFGCPADFHGFYFRSVFLPLTCVIGAVYISVEKSCRLAAGWGMAAIALLFSSLPMFYHFEWVTNVPSPVWFGLVDNFIAGVAALATAAFIRSLTNGSLKWLFAGSIMASFTLLIKPSGVAVMALLASSWIFVTLGEWFHSRHHPDISLRLKRYQTRGTILLLIVYSIFFAVSVKSQYLSSENFFFAKRALIIMKDVLAISFTKIPLMLHVSTGETIFFWAAGITVLSILLFLRATTSERRTLFKVPVFVVLTYVFWGSGIFYWLIVQAGSNQIRYFFPFFLMGLICLVPGAVHIWKCSKNWVRLGFALICFLPAGNMALLLTQKNPSLNWQRASGVSVSIGTHTA
jgi:hypothetical protein